MTSFPCLVTLVAAMKVLCNLNTDDALLKALCTEERKFFN